jgi:hypothetical protein
MYKRVTHQWLSQKKRTLDMRALALLLLAALVCMPRTSAVPLVPDWLVHLPSWQNQTDVQQNAFLTLLSFYSPKDVQTWTAMIPRTVPERERICFSPPFVCTRDDVIDLGVRVGPMTRCFQHAMEYMEFQMRCHVLAQLDARERFLQAMSQWAAKQRRETLV